MPTATLTLAAPRRQPPGPVRINPAHTLAQSLVGLWLFSEGAGGPRMLRPTGLMSAPGTFTNATWTTEKHGRAINLVAGATSRVVLGASNTLGMPTGPCTVLCGYHRTDATARQALAFGVDVTAASTSTFRLWLPSSDSNVYWDYGGNTDAVTRFVVGPITVGADDFWAATVGARGMEVWQNGIMLGSQVANPTRVATSAGLNLGAIPNDPVDADNAHWWYFAVYSRQLSSTEILLATRDPYSVLLRAGPLSYFSPSVTPVQTAVPSSDVSAGGWTASTGSDLFAMLDETAADDSDYILSARAPANAEAKVRLGPLTDPSSSTGHIVRYRYYKDPDGGARGDLTVTLYAADGTTVIATQAHTNVAPGVVAGSFTLSGAEADAIPSADYSTGLVLGFKANAP